SCSRAPQQEPGPRPSTRHAVRAPPRCLLPADKLSIGTRSTDRPRRSGNSAVRREAGTSAARWEADNAAARRAPGTSATLSGTGNAAAPRGAGTSAALSGTGNAVVQRAPDTRVARCEADNAAVPTAGKP